MSSRASAYSGATAAAAATNARTFPLTLVQCLAAHAGKKPDAVALVAGSRQWCWRDLAAETSRRAARLQRLPRPAASFLAVTGNALELALTTLAGYRAGIAILPLATEPADATNATNAKREALRTRYGERCCFTTLAEIDAVDAPPADLPDLEDLDAQAASLLIATSGSEGAPKIVVLSSAALAASAHASCERLGANTTDRWLGCLPLAHIGGQATLARALVSGGTLRLHERFDAGAIWRDIAAGDVTQISLVPAMLSRLLDVAKTPPRWLRAALLGGAALSPQLRARALAAGWPIWTSYGMSETAAMIAALPPPGDGKDDWHPGLVGTPLAGTTVDIDTDGRIRVRSVQRMNGYLEVPRDPGDEWFVTGDRGQLDARGRLTVLGRADDMLVTGGTNVHPQEVEARLATCPGIVDVAVTSTHDPVWGDVLAALIVGSIDPQAVSQWCRQHLPSPQRPRRMVQVERIPRNAMGKPNRAALRALLEPATG